MTSPANNSTLSSSSVTFTWNSGTGVSQYALWVGSAPGGSDLYAAVEGTSLSRTVTLPTDGRRLYVQLRSLIGANWLFNSYTYTAWLQPTTTTYYVDFAGGNDANNGLTTNTAWKHCPGDPNATPGSVAGSKGLTAGSTVKFKGGVHYCGSIGLRFNGASNAPIVYDGNSSGDWGATAKAVIDGEYRKDGPGQNNGFDGGDGVSHVVIRNFDIMHIGGEASFTNSQPPDLHWSVGVFLCDATNVVVNDCYFHELGIWTNGPPAYIQRLNGFGIWASGVDGLTVSGCEFTKMERGVRISPTQGKAAKKVLITGCNFHNYLCWPIELSTSGSDTTLDDITVRDCRIHDFTEYDYGNWHGLSLDPNDTHPHTDGIIIGVASDIYSHRTYGTIRLHSNFFYQNATNGGGTAMIFLTGMGGNIQIYNNVFINTLAGQGAVFVQDGPTPNHNDTPLQNLGIYNNSFFDTGKSITLQTITDKCNIRTRKTYIGIMNNVFYKTLADDVGVSVRVWDKNSLPTVLDYNCYYTPDSRQWIVMNGAMVFGTLAETRSNWGWETHGQVADPRFFNISYGLGANSSSNDLHPAAGSPCFSAGSNLYQVFTTDKDGMPRSSTGAWDIGAYED